MMMSGSFPPAMIKVAVAMALLSASGCSISARVGGSETGGAGTDGAAAHPYSNASNTTQAVFLADIDRLTVKQCAC